jgi:hypothetical protein
MIDRMEHELARALAREVVERRDQGDPTGALAAADRFMAVYGDDTSPVVRELTADVLAVRAEALSITRREPEALLAADELFARYADAPEPDLPYTAAFGLRAKATLLLNSHRDDEAAAAGERLAEFFEGRADAGRQPEIAEQLLEVGYMLMGHGQDAGRRATVSTDHRPSGGAPGAGSFGGRRPTGPRARSDSSRRQR